MSKFKAYRKAIVALVGVGVAYGLDPGVAEDIVSVATIVLVYLVPNSAE